MIWDLAFPSANYSNSQGMGQAGYRISGPNMYPPTIIPRLDIFFTFLHSPQLRLSVSQIRPDLPHSRCNYG